VLLAARKLFRCNLTYSAEQARELQLAGSGVCCWQRVCRIADSRETAANYYGSVAGNSWLTRVAAG